VCQHQYGGQTVHGSIQAAYFNECAHLDIADCGNLNMEAPFSGQRLILVITDVYTGMIVAEPLKDKTAMTVKDTFVKCYGNIYGVPRTVHTDGGLEFQSIFHDYLIANESKHTVAPVGRHDGVLAENAISRLWTALRTELTDRNLPPSYALSFVNLATRKLNHRVQHSKGKSAMELYRNDDNIDWPGRSYLKHRLQPPHQRNLNPNRVFKIGDLAIHLASNIKFGYNSSTGMKVGQHGQGVLVRVMDKLHDMSYVVFPVERQSSRVLSHGIIAHIDQLRQLPTPNNVVPNMQPPHLAHINSNLHTQQKTNINNRNNPRNLPVLPAGSRQTQRAFVPRVDPNDIICEADQFIIYKLDRDSPILRIGRALYTIRNEHARIFVHEYAKTVDATTNIISYTPKWAYPDKPDEPPLPLVVAEERPAPCTMYTRHMSTIQIVTKGFKMIPNGVTHKSRGLPPNIKDYLIKHLPNI
jgi:hypothetical protein